ncbi:MAG TPA: glycosyltransferase 87 family protein [Candidatus Limnocylindria bacterium]|nr:glycosyltransferase 87 family protein [Candidatus Limnocylindria bacterium]
MRALFRMAAIGVAGAALYYAGLLNSIVIQRPDRPGAIAVVVAIGAALVVLVAAVRGTGAGDAATPRGRGPGPASQASVAHTRIHRAIWLFVCVMALVSLAWIYDVPRQRAFDWTPYHNDAIALNECAARLVLDGRDPYASLDIFDCYGRLGIGADRTTPLRRGLFADVTVYPTDDQFDAAWAVRSTQGGNVEFVSRLSYPSLSFLLIVPFVALGWDTNRLYLLCLVAAMALVVMRTPGGLRPFMLTAVLGAASLAAFTVGGSADLLYALPLVAAWLWREHRWSAIAYGVAIATKQLAWFFGVFYLIAVIARSGWREGLRRAALAVGVFAMTNLPFIVRHPADWTAGVLTPLVEPMFPRGAGIVFLGTNGGLPLLPASAYLALEVACALACVVLAWRSRHSSPELGVVLALVPLFFAWRSLFSYFFLLPLFASAAVARMPLGDLVPARARDLGALTLFAMPARRLAVVARRGRAA